MKRRHPISWLACVTLACVGACGQRARDGRAEAAPEKVVETAEATSPSAAARSTSATPRPSRLLTVNGSAYGATLASTESGNYLLAGSAAYRWVAGEAPARWAGDFGSAPALTPGHLLFWSEGSLRRVPTHGGAAELVTRVSHPPQRLVTSGDHVAWLHRAADGRFTIHTLDGSRQRVVHAPRGYVGALAMEDERIYFAERAPDRSWRLGLVPRSGGAAHYTKPKRGRLPAMLVVTESLYYYDGPSSTVLRVSPDLATEELLARDVICSPIAVATNVYCAQPAGLVEIGNHGGVLRTFALERPGAITAVAATATQLMWVTDVGGERLAVDSISL